MFYTSCKYEVDSISNGGRVRIRMKNGEGGWGGGSGGGGSGTHKLYGKIAFRARFAC